MAALLPFDGEKEKKRRGGKRAKGDGGLTAPGALDLMRRTGDADGVFTVASRSELARILKWERTRTSKALDRWAATGAIVLDDDIPGNILIRVMPDRSVASDGKGSATSRVKALGTQRPATREIARPSRREHAPPTAREFTPPEHRETVPAMLPTTRPGINNAAEGPGRPAVTAPPPTAPAIHAAPHWDVPVSIDTSPPAVARWIPLRSRLRRDCLSAKAGTSSVATAPAARLLRRAGKGAPRSAAGTQSPTSSKASMR